MAQFWCEFTKEVLVEFLHEDFLIKEMKAEERIKAKQSAGPNDVTPTES